MAKLNQFVLLNWSNIENTRKLTLSIGSGVSFTAVKQVIPQSGDAC